MGPGPRGGAQSDPNPKYTPNLRKPQATQHSKQSALGTLPPGSLLAPALHYILVSPQNFRHMPASEQNLRPRAALICGPLCPRQKLMLCNFWVRPGNIRHRDSVVLIQFGTCFDKSLAGVSLLCRLQELRFGRCFNKPLDDVVLPATLQIQTFGNGFQQSLKNVILPKGCQIVKH